MRPYNWSGHLMAACTAALAGVVFMMLLNMWFSTGKDSESIVLVATVGFVIGMMPPFSPHARQSNFKL